ncbi:hypothetical protein ABBQ38_002031 [Trebouxia sp. C0009 RCD-2024]
MCTEAQRASGLALTRIATRAAIAEYDKERNLTAVLSLFEEAVRSKEADTDLCTDTMASCFARGQFEVDPHVFHQWHVVNNAVTNDGSRMMWSTSRRDVYGVFKLIAGGGGLWCHCHYRSCAPATASACTALLTFCAKHAPNRALDVWHAMQEVPPPPFPAHVLPAMIADINVPMVPSARSHWLSPRMGHMSMYLPSEPPQGPLLKIGDGVPVSLHLFSSLFAACAAAGTQEMLEAADKSHMDMEGLWNKICSKGKTAAEERCMPRQLQLANDHKCCDAGASNRPVVV